MLSIVKLLLFTNCRKILSNNFFEYNNSNYNNNNKADYGPRCQTKCAVYKLICNICKQIYIGETKRFIKSRIVEHLKFDKQSAVIKHFEFLHPTANIVQSVTWCILTTAINDNLRKCMECIYINVERQVIMNGCDCIEMPAYLKQVTM